MPAVLAFDRPFRLRSLSAILARLSEQAAAMPIGTTVADWCRREDVHLLPAFSVADATREVQAALFAELPSLELTSRR